MDFQFKLVSLHFISAILIGIVSSHPTYVPNSPDVCSKMTPGHGPRPQPTTSPYQILLNKQSMTGGNNLQITIRGKKGRKFKGFYIQVRDIDGIPVGTFLSPDENEAGTHGCFNQKNNAIHHKNRNDKDSITVYWKAPEDHEGQVRVLGTILQDFETYWTNVQAADPVSISNSSPSMIFKPSPQFPEKAEKEAPKLSKANGILNYNPYSPFSPLSSWDRMDIHIQNSSSEFLLPQPSEQSSVAQERQLVGPTSFDFHGGLYTKVGGLKSKNNYPPPSLPHHYHHHPHLRPSSLHGPSSINEQLPPLPNHHQHNSIESQHFQPPSNSLFQPGPGKPEVKERHPSYPFHQTPSFPAIDSPYQFHFPDPSNDIQKKPLQFTPSKHPDSFDYAPHQQQPHFTQSIFDKNGHHIVNHHYISPNTPTIQQPFHYPPPHHHQLHHHIHKPASDPSYPNSGYFPKDILTKLTSYIPNIYNAITNNPLFNFNVDNTIESIWKPSKGIPPQQHSILAAGATPPKVEMPKYGYLVYNPVRNNPYYVIPAMNEDEFVANHMRQR